MLDPWRFAWEFTYGSSTWSDDDALNRQGMDGRSFDGISRQLGYSRHLRLGCAPAMTMILAMALSACPTW